MTTFDFAKAKRTIFFEDVFRGGEPRHEIVNYPFNSSRFFILECAENRIQFGSSALAGATEHVCSAAHGQTDASPFDVLVAFGKVVWHCNARKAEVNNKICAEHEARALQEVNRSSAREETGSSISSARVEQAETKDEPTDVRIKREAL